MRTEVPFNPSVKDGRGTRAWRSESRTGPIASTTPPFVAFQVTCGITFTFGGLRITPDKAAVMSNEGVPIRGLYAAGEIVGGLFYLNYPGGTGLTAGSVFGRIAGGAAAEHSGR